MARSLGSGWGPVSWLRPPCHAQPGGSTSPAHAPPTRQTQTPPGALSPGCPQGALLEWPRQSFRPFTPPTGVTQWSLLRPHQTELGSRATHQAPSHSNLGLQHHTPTSSSSSTQLAPPRAASPASFRPPTIPFSCTDRGKVASWIPFLPCANASTAPHCPQHKL